MTEFKTVKCFTCDQYATFSWDVELDTYFATCGCGKSVLHGDTMLQATEWWNNEMGKLIESAPTMPVKHPDTEYFLGIIKLYRTAMEDIAMSCQTATRRGNEEEVSLALEEAYYAAQSCLSAVEDLGGDDIHGFTVYDETSTVYHKIFGEKHAIGYVKNKLFDDAKKIAELEKTVSQGVNGQLDETYAILKRLRDKQS